MAKKRSVTAVLHSQLRFPRSPPLPRLWKLSRSSASPPEPPLLSPPASPSPPSVGVDQSELGDECNYFSWFDEEEGTKWQRRALIEARDEIRQKTRVIEQLIKSISEMKSNLENKEIVDDDNDDGVVRKFEEFYV
ncbi:hypothetical protein F2Q70_00027245 [Brassica cretica]|uniref:Uncharacterized protein n=1 Tax=Brassica cretica TaxID=69181 RepID=A0A8S9L9M7_BRACR|nr:hypothetical protein F2Q70_00027245 [Brassica cretica]